MKQIALPIVLSIEQTLESFVPGSNSAVLEHLALFAKHPNRSPVPTYIWGESGSGKTHLLQAVSHELNKLKQAHCYLGPEQAQAQLRFDPAWEVILMDDVDQYDAAQQHFAFNCFVNALTPSSGLQRWVLAAGSCPPKDLELREDLRTRLGWGHIFHLQTLGEEGCKLVLQQHAAELGLHLSQDLQDYILSRFSRDLSSLVQLLKELDSYALQTKRAITIPLLKSMLDER
jgi:DnaA family protein